MELPWVLGAGGGRGHGGLEDGVNLFVGYGAGLIAADAASAEDHVESVVENRFAAALAGGGRAAAIAQPAKNTGGGEAGNERNEDEAGADAFKQSVLFAVKAVLV